MIKKNLLLILLIAVLLGGLSACGGSEEEKKARAIIKEYLIKDSMFRLKAKDYRPFKTTIDSCFFAAIEDEQTLLLSKQLMETYRAIQSPNAEMEELLRMEEPDLKRVEELTIELENLHDRFVELEIPLKNRIGELPPDFVGWIVTHEFVHRLEDGTFEEVSMQFVFNKEFDKLLYPDRFREDGEIVGDHISAILLLSFELGDRTTPAIAVPDDDISLLEGGENVDDFELPD